MTFDMNYTDPNSLATTIAEFMQRTLTDLGISGPWTGFTKFIILALLVTGVVYLLQFVTKAGLTFIFKKIHKYTKLSFFGYLIDNKLPRNLARVVPYSFVRSVIPVVFVNMQGWIGPMLTLTDVYMVFMVIWTIMSFVRALFDRWQEKPAFKNKPTRSYIQVVYIILFIIGTIIIYWIVTGNSAKGFFAAMGAASAILMLIFQDSIKGFVGSIQVSANDMVKIGDWITMNKYGADGDVEEINLTTVKIRNFDKTITTIPTYALISDSFQNWRGMEEYKGRRFKRALNIKQDSIRFLGDGELEKFKEVGGLKEYIERKQKEYAELNKTLGAEVHRVTNNDLFLQYGTFYLRSHPKINKKLTLLVRQLPPTPQGLPIELYTFTATTAWAEYEVILSEVVNHLIGMIPAFDLKIYEELSGGDIYNVNMRRDA